MESVDNIVELDFPFVSELPRAKRRSAAEHQVERLMRLNREHGALLPVQLVAGLLGVHRSRVHQLADKGSLERIDIGDLAYITATSAVSYARSERHAGRMTHLEKLSVRDIWNLARGK